jgi:uncharacterized phage protein gp47/JayE
VPRFEPKTFTYFLERMANRVVARTNLTDLEEGGALHTILAAAARELDDISFQMVNLQRIWDLDTATGEDLDDRALDLNPEKLSRNGLSFSSGQVQFARTGTAGNVTVPQGTIVKVPNGGPQFSTNAPVTILDTFTTSPLVGIIAIVGGLAGNVDSGAISQLDAVSGIETVTNPAATIGGQEVETDAEFRSRVKTFLRSLPRGTPDALKFAVLSAFLPDLGRVVTAEVVELPEPDLGRVYIYADDGSGTIEITDDNIGSPETVVASAIGGEVRLFLDNIPVKLGTPVDVEINAVPVFEGVDYTINRATGQITLDPTLYPTGLAPGDSLTAEYTWMEGLIAEAQKIVDGDATDRINYPGYRAAGTQVFILPPTVLQQIVEAQVIIDNNRLAEGTAIRSKIRSAINRYINGLGINGDVILSELVFQAQSVGGVLDVTFTTPTSNVIIGEGELARVTDSNIDLT